MRCFAVPPWLVERRPDGDGDERLRRHHFRNGNLEARLEAEVAVVMMPTRWPSASTTGTPLMW